MTELLTQLSILLAALLALLSPQLGAIVVEEKIELNGKLLTSAEYAERKTILAARVDDFKLKGSHFDDYRDFSDWIAILNRECKNKSFTGLSVEKINKKLKDGC